MMSILRRCVCACLLAHVLVPASAFGQATQAPVAQRRDIPMSAAILRAHAAGTRDSTGRPGRNYWALRTAYTIDAQLDVATSIVRARATIVLHNTSPAALDVIQLRLDQNRFRPRTPPDLGIPHPTAGMTVTRLVVNGAAATIGETPGARLPALSGTHRTSERLTLARPIASGDSAVLEADWHFEVPLDDTNGALRLGRTSDGTYQVAQWYPRIAMYDDLNGWDTTSYSGAVEFYNPYGRFDVRIDVPAALLVGATGVHRNADQVLSPRTRRRLDDALMTDSVITVVGRNERGPGAATLNAERLVWHFVADTVSDFAWGASPDYVWNAARIVIPDRAPILAHMLLRPANAERADTAASLLRRIVAFGSTRLMPYAFAQHTLLDGPEGGMEYPMLTMSHGGRLPHELAHQWFPMMVGSNETWYGFMDEGFANYVATIASLVGPDAPLEVSRAARPGAPLIWPDDRGPPDILLAAVYGYGKPLEMFAELETMVGRNAVVTALGSFATAWRFKHPSPWDFMFFMNNALRRNLDDFWFRWLFSAG